MTVRRLVLIEAWSPEVELRPDDLVVAVTAEALQDLRSRGIAHVTPEQFGFVERLREAEKRLWPAQLDWLEQSGHAIAETAPGQEAEARHFPWAYGWPLKSLVDRLIVANAEAESILTACPVPSSICLYEDASIEEAEAQVFAGWENGARARRVVWSEVARELQIELETRLLAMPLPSTRSLRRSVLRLARAGASLFHRESKPAARAETLSPAGRTAVFLEHGPDIDAAAAELTKRGVPGFFPDEDGEEVFLRSTAGDSTAVFAAPIERGSWDAGEKLAPALADAARSFAPDRILAPAARGLATWLAARVPSYLSRAATCRQLIAAAGVRAVFTSHLTSDLSNAFIGAAAAAADVETALIAHGDSPEVAPVWDLHELMPYRHYFVPNSEFAEYFSERRALLGRDAATVRMGTFRWADYRQWKQPPSLWLNRWDYAVPRPRRRSPLPVGRKPVVVYITSWVSGHLRYLGKPDFTENSTHDLQVAICDVLGRAPHVTAVIKLYPNHRPCSAIERHLRENGSRVIVSRAPMRNWFPRADALIVDHPSTSLYQAAMAGVPALPLLYEGFCFRASALAGFPGGATFATPREAGERVEQFLRALPATPRALVAFDAPPLAPQLIELARADAKPLETAKS